MAATASLMSHARYKNGLRDGGHGRGVGGGCFQGRDGDYGGRHVSEVTRGGRSSNKQEEENTHALVVYDQLGDR